MRSARLLACASTSVALVAAVTFTVDQAAAAPGGGAGQATTTVPAADTSPQPFSNADNQNTGANDTSGTNQYLSTRNGSPSGNGSGNGAATGEPCAGCVGKADNKNPPGQFPNGSDANAGYECDANQGVGKSNPAHTACTPPPSSTTTTSPTSTTTTTTTAASGSGGASGPAPPGPSPSSGGAGGSSSVQEVESTLRSWISQSSTAHAPGPATAAASGGGSLAFSGSNLARDALLGMASVLLAAVLYLVDSRLRRRRLASPLP
jgi:hypothetical protein